MRMGERLKGRVCVITGSSRGVGEATARLLAEEGASLLLAARTEAEVSAVAEACRQRGAPAYWTRCDVTQESDVAGLARNAQELFGRVDVLINNAGVGRYAYLEELTTQDFAQMLDVNVTGVFRVTRALLPLLRRSSHGHIVNISSIRGLEAIAKTTGYAASKFGLMGLSEALSREVHKDGIRVTVICPGGIRSHFGGTAPHEKPAGLLNPEDVAQAILYTLLTPAHVEVSQLILVPFRPE